MNWQTRWRLMSRCGGFWRRGFTAHRGNSLTRNIMTRQYHPQSRREDQRRMRDDRLNGRLLLFPSWVPSKCGW